jgi:hypothetical protein
VCAWLDRQAALHRWAPGRLVRAAAGAEFGTWLDRERGLSPVSVRCYCKQAKHFLAAIGGPELVSWTRAELSRLWWSIPATATAGQPRRW